MNQSHLIALLLVSLLSGCDQSKPVTKLTCNDNHKRHLKAEQMASADQCFRKGKYKKSSGMGW